MSCGNPHAVDCVEVLAKVYLYLDREIAGHDLERVRTHLEECGPCLEAYGLESLVKALVARSCGCGRAPETLRLRVLAQLRETRVSVSAVDMDPPLQM